MIPRPRGSQPTIPPAIDARHFTGVFAVDVGDEDFVLPLIVRAGDRLGFPGQMLIIRRKLHRLSIVGNDPPFTAADFFDEGARVLRIRDQAAIGRIDAHPTGQLRPLRSIGDVDRIHTRFHLRAGLIDEQDLLRIRRPRRHDATTIGGQLDAVRAWVSA